MGRRAFNSIASQARLRNAPRGLVVQIFGQEAGVWATRNNVGIAIAIPISFTVEVVHVVKDRLYRCGGFAVPPIEDETLKK